MSIIQQKSFDFALEIITLYKKLIEQKEYVISKQLLRSATSIGANVVEGGAGQSERDFLHKMSIASKEAQETKYWLNLLQYSKLVDLDYSGSLLHCDEVCRILTSIVKTMSEKIKKTTQNS
ncbi:MAG: four helix bundle protein [Ignavibacteriota bacterium]